MSQVPLGNGLPPASDQEISSIEAPLTDCRCIAVRQMRWQKNGGQLAAKGRTDMESGARMRSEGVSRSDPPGIIARFLPGEIARVLTFLTARTAWGG